MSTRRALTMVASILTVTLSAGCTGSSDAPAENTATTADSGAAADPSTVEGACSLLVGPSSRWVTDALSAGRAVVDGGGASANVEQSETVQSDLFTIVSEGPKELQDPAGQLVDYLDDPEAYETAGDVDPLVTGAVEDIARACAGQ